MAPVDFINVVPEFDAEIVVGPTPICQIVIDAPISKSVGLVDTGMLNIFADPTSILTIAEESE